MGHFWGEITMGYEATVPLKVEVLDKIAALVTATFGLAAALAWNDAINP